MYDSYAHHGFLTPSVIERLRLKYRLRVVQQLEDGVGRNVVRSVVGDGYFSQDELQVRCCLAVKEHFFVKIILKDSKSCHLEINV